MHLLNTIQKENHKLGKSKNAYDCLRFEVEDRFECGLTGKVKYKSRVEDPHVEVFDHYEAEEHNHSPALNENVK